MAGYNKAVAIVPSDTVNIVDPPDAVYVGGAGVVVAVFANGAVVNFTAVAGQVLPITVKRVNSTSTTATLLVGLSQV